MAELNEGDKLYIVVCRDLGPGPMLAQAVHASRAFTATYPELDLEWYTVSNTVAILEVPGEVELLDLLNRARLRRLKTALFREPDLDQRVTAAAFEPAAKSLLRRLPEALS